MSNLKHGETSGLAEGTVDKISTLEMWGNSFTLPKFNMEHSHGGLEDPFPFQMGDL